MVIYIGVNKDGKVEGWGTSPSDNTIKLEVDESHPFLNDNPFNYFYRNGELTKDSFTELEGLKSNRDKELSESCERAILSGFPLEIFGSTYHFSYDKEAQTNILDTMRLFENNMIDEITWNARLKSVDGKRVRMTLTKDHFFQLYMASVKHKFGCISKYRDDLTELLNNASTTEEIESITWESIKDSTFKGQLKDDQTVEKIVAENEMKQARGDSELLNLIIMRTM